VGRVTGTPFGTASRTVKAVNGRLACALLLLQQQQEPSAVGHYAGGASGKTAGQTALAGHFFRFLLSGVPQWLQIAGVITSAGVVLAATFSVLGTLPLVFLAELGFAVAFGVLLDTLVVRTFLVPALTYDIGRPIWWPSRLGRVAEPAAEPHEVPAGVG